MRTSAADYRLIARIKNNRLWAAIQARWPGVKSQNEAARCLGVGASYLGLLLNMRVWPYNRHAEEWSPVAIRIAKRLRETPEHLFEGALYGIRPQVIDLAVDRPALEAAGLIALPESTQPDEVAMVEERRAALEAALDTLTPREAHVLRARFGFDGAERTLENIGNEMDVSPERVRQIEKKALRKLRKPKVALTIRPHES